MASTDGADKQLIRYAKSSIAEAPDGAEITRDADWSVPASSFVEVAGELLASLHRSTAGSP